VAQLGQTLT